MTLRDEFKAYKDKNGYMNPYTVAPNAGRSCDNATLFTSEYYILLALNNELDLSEYWRLLIALSSMEPGLTVRYPGDNTIDAPDNVYGILAASKVLAMPSVAHDFLRYGRQNLGFYNTSNPGHIKNQDGRINWNSFLWRQPQLIFMALCASGVYKPWKFWYWPLALYTSIVILTSCMQSDRSDSGSRLLAWLLIQATKQDSLLCRLASLVWNKRLLADYGGNGMKQVASMYFQPSGNNPYAKYWPIT